MALNFFDPKTELTKDKNLREDDIKTLIDWVNKQAHLPKINEVQAILFLQSCNYRNEAAKSAIDSYFTVKTFCADLFGGRNPLQSPLRESLNVALFAFLPKKTPQGDTIIFMKLMDSNPDNYNFSVQLKHFDMVCMLGLHQEGVSNGHIIVLDMKEVVFGHLTKLGPLAMKKFLYYLQEAMPLRLKGLHYFNIVPFMDKILALMRPFMKKELLDMLYLHNTVDDLVKFVPRECLPLDYGGSVESTHVIHEKTKNKLRENCAFFDWEDKQVVDESQRAGKPKNVSDIFGVEGTFKKLELIKKKMSLNLADVKCEYSKNPTLKQEDVKSLMEWVNKQPHLPKINELQAILFLQSCYNRNEAAKAAIDTFFTVKTLCSDLFGGRNPLTSPNKDTMNVSLMTPLPRETPEGHCIFLFKLIDTNPDKYIFGDQLRCFDMMIMRHLHQCGTSNGHLILFDMKGVVFGHVTKLGPLNMKKFLYYLQEAMPVRLKGLHFFNIVPFMDKILALMKPFMKKEMIDMLYLHNTVDDLVKQVPRDCLPQEYGGSAESMTILHEKMKRTLCENSAFFEWEDGQKVDESLRPGKPKNVGDYFGVEGTFKKLELD
nr:PREDICTED: uncharacterized protein LOC655774 [Tribolium castaneum]|eukprot:XP_015838049.1 PREDICTED: uncharacterized protein LOC655774 [Tribolium castaneum]